MHLIPESDNPEDDKIFLFFKENAMDGEHSGKATIARIGQLCKVTTHTQQQQQQFTHEQQKDSLLQLISTLYHRKKCIDIEEYVDVNYGCCFRMIWEVTGAW